MELEKDGVQLDRLCEKWSISRHRVNEERNSLQAIKRRRVDWVDQIFSTNCSLKHVMEEKIEGRIEVTGRQGRRCKQLLDNPRKKFVLEIKR